MIEVKSRLLEMTIHDLRQVLHRRLVLEDLLTIVHLLQGRQEATHLRLRLHLGLPLHRLQQPLEGEVRLRGLSHPRETSQVRQVPSGDVLV